MKNSIINSSIRYKLLAYMTVSIMVFALLLLGANTFFAERYYIRHNKNILIRTTKEIEQLISDMESTAEFRNEEVIYKLNRLEKSIGGSITIGKASDTIYYPFYHDIKALPKDSLIINPFADISKGRQNMNKKIFILPRSKVETISNVEIHDEKSFFMVNKDPGFKIDTLRYQRQLDNGIIILVWIPMAEISESAAVSNRFTAIIALITIFIMGIWALYISDKFTKPIKQINSTAKMMAELDFSQKLDIDGADEIGQLSNSINYLSNKLNLTINELHEKNLQLEKDIDKGKKVDSMRREFVSNVSHELKTPIFLIQGYAEGLKNNVADNPDKKNFYCDVIMEEADKMDIIVKDLLNLSQIESGNMELNKRGFNIEYLISDVIDKMKPVFDEKNISVEVELGVGKEVNGDPIRIEQVLVNYLNNAINHVDNIRKLTVKVQEFKGKVRTTVFNSGQAIPEELLERIWLSFYKVDKARTRSYGGTGLGLAIVKAIQEAHGNGYGVQNVNGGVEFWFEIDFEN